MSDKTAFEIIFIALKKLYPNLSFDNDVLNIPLFHLIRGFEEFEAEELFDLLDELGYPINSISYCDTISDIIKQIQECHAAT